MLKLVHKHFSSKRLSFVLLVLGKPNSTLVLTCLSYVKPPSIGWSYSLENEWKSIKFPEVLGKGNFQLINFVFPQSFATWKDALQFTEHPYKAKNGELG